MNDLANLHRRRNVRSSAGSLAALLLGLSSVAGAQVRASERASVSQTVDGTVITIDYGRPQLRGRKVVFPDIVPPEEVWTPGANASSTLDATREITIGGKSLPAGKYSMWLVTKGPWTMYFHKNATLFHTRHPKIADMALGVPVERREGESLEILTFDFPVVSGTGTELRFRWGTTSISMPIAVTPTHPSLVMSPAEAARYTGSYLITYSDSGGTRTKPVNFEIMHRNGYLRGIADDPKEPFEFEFMPSGKPDTWLPGIVKDGKVIDVEMAAPTTFEIVDGKVVGFSVGGGSQPWILGKRKG